ncbi:hypothetical protein D0Z07_9383 [Hyphodiscus hymeniophilus]|uniref:Uncharacterized protein n=1 Tax=Hyphodiscus hymeniophilus TaxID=353542 RepID=A0A9P6SM95_9HELO|nr:hypothetical protein D0Z07_9383 [Hyphodiscus hymeniophilus]
MAADTLDVMMEYGMDDDVISGVLARTDMGSDEQLVYWALTAAYVDNDSWQAGFESCQSGAQTSFTEAPGAALDIPVVPDASSVDDFNAALNPAQPRSSFVESSEEGTLARRVVTGQPTCNRVYQNFGTDFHYRCYCDNRQYDLFCDYITSAAATPWTESARQAAITGISVSVGQMWTQTQ